ncbi:hypothetical protein ACFO5K_20640 [Nocardia halotolerans]|uniref:MmyB-like transcription regulator ligand binding domain-containing protein n=1 Tax=Nocardia halotolerans TaxID=1755878 RepID=A0ABV8VMF6_9NOCA
MDTGGYGSCSPAQRVSQEPPRSPETRVAGASTSVASAGCMVCAVKNWLCLPASVSTTTRGWSRVVPGMFPGPCSMPWRALQLDPHERVHLQNLAKLAAPRTRLGRPQQVGPEMPHSLQTLAAVLACIIGGRLDILAWNDLARLLIGDVSRPASPNATWTACRRTARRLPSLSAS